MAQLEDLANTAVSKSQIMDAFHPFVLAARRIMDQRAALSVPSGSAPADCESGPALAPAPVIEPVAGSASSLAKEAITEVLSSAEGSNNPSFRILRKRLSTLPNHEANALSTAASDPAEESALYRRRSAARSGAVVQLRRHRRYCRHFDNGSYNVRFRSEIIPITLISILTVRRNTYSRR